MHLTFGTCWLRCGQTTWGTMRLYLSAVLIAVIVACSSALPDRAVLAEEECDHQLNLVSFDPPCADDPRQIYFRKTDTIELELTISETGSVVTVDVISSITPYWDELWTTVAKGCEFDVCMKEGKPRMAVKRVSYTMTLAE